MNIILLPGQYGNKYPMYYTNSHICCSDITVCVVYTKWWSDSSLESLKKKSKEFSGEFPKNKPHEILYKAPTFTTDPTHGFKRKTLRVKWNTRPAIRLLRNFCSQLCGVSTILTSNFTERYESSIQSVNQNDFFFFSSAVGNLFHMFVLKE